MSAQLQSVPVLTPERTEAPKMLHLIDMRHFGITGEMVALCGKRLSEYVGPLRAPDCVVCADLRRFQ